MACLRGGLASQLGALRFRPYANDPLEAEFEERAIMNLERPVRDVDAEIRIDSDQLGLEGCMMDFRGFVTATLSSTQ